MDISWFMRMLNESIARLANKEDDCKGRFWEGRFKSQALLDEAAVLACMAYVDLNPVRAGIAELPETSDFTSIQQRLSDLAECRVGRPKQQPIDSPKVENSLTKPSQEGKINLKKPELFPFNHGFDLQDGERAIAFSLSDYAELIDWTGRAIRADKLGAISEEAPPILARLGLSEEGWLKYVPSVERHFTHAIGNSSVMKDLAARHGLAWLHGQSLCSRFKATEYY